MQHKNKNHADGLFRIELGFDRANIALFPINVTSPITIEKGNITKEDKTVNPLRILDELKPENPLSLVKNLPISTNAAAAKQADIKYPLLIDQYSEM